MGRRHPPAVVCYLLPAAVGGLVMGNAHAQPPPPPQQLTSTVSRTVSIVITVAISAFFVLVFFCVLVNQCRRSEDAGEGGGQGSTGRRRRGLDRAAVAALPIVPYVEIRKHKNGVLECAVCLTEFDGGDVLRLLPQCSHAFHPDCIDPWLEGHVTCPLCRANVEKQPAPSPALALSSSPETEPQTPEAVAVRLEVESDDDERREEAVELERLRSVRRAARMPRSHSTGHSLSTATSAPAPAEVGDDHERFTVRLPPHVREEVLKSRRLRHSTSLVVGLGGSSCEGSSRGDGGGSWHDARRWPSFLARTVSWARGGGEGSVRRGGVGADTGTKGTAVP